MTTIRRFGRRLPAIWQVGGPAVDRNTALMVDIVARLGTGVSRAQAQAELSAVATSMNTRLDSNSAADRRHFPAYRPDRSNRRCANALVVAIVMSVIGLVLLLACVNVDQPAPCQRDDPPAGVCRPARARASRWRIVRQLMTESLVLGIAGGASGCCSPPGSCRFLPGSQRRRQHSTSARTSCMAFSGRFRSSLASARASCRRVMAMRDNFASLLKGSSLARAGPPDRGHRVPPWWNPAASLVLLVVAALLTRGMVRATQVDRLRRAPSDDRSGIRAAPTTPRDEGVLDSRARAGALRRLPMQLARSPSASVQRCLQGDDFRAWQQALRHLSQRHGRRVLRDRRIARRAGTDAYGLEVAERAPVAVISERMARDFFAGEDPVGQSLAKSSRAPAPSSLASFPTPSPRACAKWRRPRSISR